MLNYCRKCGHYSADKIISQDGKTMICPKCNEEQSFKQLPLFVITGASGVGKSSLCIELFKRETDYIVMESDILWNDSYNTPEDDYRVFRETWLRICKNISQAGKPVVLCGSSVPKQFESCIERRYFSEIHYLACVCDSELLENRLRVGRSVDDESWINSSIEFNQWLIDNAEETKPKITLLDTTEKSIKEAAEFADEWIKKGIITYQE